MRVAFSHQQTPHGESAGKICDLLFAYPGWDPTWIASYHVQKLNWKTLQVVYHSFIFSWLGLEFCHPSKPLDRPSRAKIHLVIKTICFVGNTVVHSPTSLFLGLVFQLLSNRTSKATGPYVRRLTNSWRKMSLFSETVCDELTWLVIRVRFIQRRVPNLLNVHLHKMKPFYE